ncbi:MULTISPECIES: TetR/AcrR family transcriptional regulator [Streptomycetaceae]|uniref:TetR family transcriptional regulator n=1 Tax=Streptantibioticus cattleyicolor (strain ATCC 35852 / DSM 46488 / JCM 4925 / NBRC 14057 / NRRL 8057) TaxID=1003195 RepID=F8JSU3_STREN|nr:MULTISPECIES: TetR/AcrR family transcriptional regulator [Streptomycetaceae]AEW98001.1 TetR family transcriptional regulator [Streptantibioticus cattleyicolor NRRL 8057 = DSM 46488]MYS62401.1 TetR family transcriptional regulator [Streptomyces sp. SID5468]CCB78319.1 Transcriptional regulator, TetR family [Streptantibioticus cattleyicolor NRRL 8057 = DSM 46488]
MGEDDQRRGGRRGDADATRQALLDAASVLFAERGYERTTVRAIAARAGANQALLFRYFGSKRALFGEVMARNGRQRLLATEPERLLEVALRGLLPDDEDGPCDRSLEAFLRSAGSTDEVGAAGRLLGEEYARALGTLSDADDAALRADLVLAWLLGIGLTRVVVRKEPLAGAVPDDICALVLPAARSLLEGLAPPARPER